MSNMQAIEIDFDVHKAIELARMSFAETPNDVLRRILQIDVNATSERLTDGNSEPTVPRRSWRGKGAELPHGTQLRMDYNGRIYTGEIRNGDWAVEGISYNAPSAAANGVAITRDGSKTQLNGWNYWEALLPGSKKWIPIRSLRPDR